MRGGQGWLLSLAEMGAPLNYSVILYLLDHGLCTTTHTLLRLLTRTRNEASSELESSKGHDKVVPKPTTRFSERGRPSCGDSGTSLGQLFSRRKQMDRALSEMVRPLVRLLRDIQQKILQSTDEGKCAQITISLYQFRYALATGFIWITMESPSFSPLGPDRRFGPSLDSHFFYYIVSMTIHVRLR